MPDYFVDLVENEEEPLGPEELVRNGLELYATAKGAPLKIRMTILRGAKHFLELGLAWSDQKGPRLPNERVHEARRVVDEITTQLAALKVSKPTGTKKSAKAKRGSVEELAAKLAAVKTGRSARSKMGKAPRGPKRTR